MSVRHLRHRRLCLGLHAWVWILILATAVPAGASDDPPLAPPPGLDVETTYGEPTTVSGRLIIEPIPAGKRFQGTWLDGDGDQKYVLSYRPVPEYFPFVDKRVVVVGRPYYQGSDVQQIMADHFEVESIELAPGEVARSPVPATLPAPPLARTVAELAGREGLWVQLVGVFAAYQSDEGSEYWGVATIEIEGGTTVPANVSASHVESLKKGAVVTLVGRVEGPTWSLTDVRAMCAGQVEGCGIQAPTPDGQKQKLRP
jgi:hypothetical protein